MKYFTLIMVIILTASACKKDNSTPRLSFSENERKWFIYHTGQEFKFKNLAGDSVTYVVDTVIDYFIPEYEDTLNSVKTDDAEYYVAHLSAKDDFINIGFYKSSQFGSDPSKLNQTIGWHDVAGQFVELENITNKAPFTSYGINNSTYNKVTPAIPMTYTQYPWTKWINAFYDQNAGFIIFIDKNGNYWCKLPHFSLQLKV